MMIDLTSYRATFAFLQIVEAPSTSLSEAIIRVGLATLFVALFGFGLVIWIRKRGVPAIKQKPSARRSGFGKALSGLVQTSAPQTIEIISTRKIGPGQSLVDVEWKGRKLLLGHTAQSIQVLSEDLSDHEADRP